MAPLAQVITPSYDALATYTQLTNYSPIKPITLKLSGKVIKNRLYRTPLSEYASTYDETNVEQCGKPLPRYAELYQGIDLSLPLPHCPAR